MANISDVAKRAGVGVSTVSKVLNDYDNISEETRKKVLKAVDELDYVPNAIASALSSKQGRRVALIIFINNQRQAIDEINMQYLFGAFNKASEHKLDLVTVFSSVIKDMDSIELERHLKSLRVQALVIYGLHKGQEAIMELIDKQIFPTVIVDAPILGEKTSYVMVDHQKAQYEMTKFMCAKHDYVKSILYLAGRRDGFVTDLRLQGVVDASIELGVDLNAQYANFSEKKAFDLTKKYGEEANIIIAASDLMAIGAVSALKQMDIFRPVCGFDGITLLGYIDYRIYSVKQDFYGLSQSAMDEVAHLLQGNPGRANIHDFEITKIEYEDVIM